MRHGHAQGAGEGLEDGLGLVVVVVAAGRDLEVAPRGACERVEEVAEHFGRNVANPLAAERGVPLEVDAAPEVEQRQRPAVVHRQGEAVAGDPGLRAQRAVDGLAQRDGHVLHRVVFVDVQIAPRVDGQRDAAVVGDLREHVVQKAQARGDLAVEIPAAVEVEADGDLRLAGLAPDFGPAFAAADEFGDFAPRVGDQRTGVGGAGFQLGTDNLQWEVSKTFNVGFDASFFRGKLNLGFDYFNKHTTDILVKPQTPLILGTELQNYNAGEMRTQGWELTPSYALKKRDWSHFFQFNIGDSWNKVLKYEGFEDISGQEEFWRITREGLPFNSYYGYKTDGFFQSYDEIAHSAVPTGKSVKPGDVKFKDRNGDGTIDENDRYYLGNAFPRYTLGFTYNVAWKGIDLSIFLQGVLKRDMMVRGELIEPFHSNYGNTMYEHQLDFWTPTNTDARWPRLTDISDPSNQNNYRMGSDLYMFDGSYLRLKNIQLGYTLPERISMKFGVKRFKIYFNAQNLLTFSNCSFIDPESSEFGSNMNSGGANSGRNYPNLRYFGAGLNITF